MLTRTTYCPTMGPSRSRQRCSADMPLTSGQATNSGRLSMQARSQNLGRLLTLVHRQGAQSRAALTRRTGLNRSTIAGLVAELTDLGLVRESGPTESAGVGRPS